MLGCQRKCPTKTDRWSVFCLVLGVLGCAAAPAPSMPSPVPAPATKGKSTAARLDEVSATTRFCEVGPEEALARGRAALAEANVQATEVRPNPILSATHERILTGRDLHETVLGLEVPMSLGGRRGLLRRAARMRQAQRAVASKGDLLEAAVAFRASFILAALTRSRLRLMTARWKDYESLVQRLDRLQGGGEHAGLDRDRLRVESALVATEAANLRLELEGQRAWLEAVVGATVALPDRPGPPTLDGVPNGRRLPPRVAALRLSAQASQLEAAAARRRSVPDADLFVGYRTAGGGGSGTGHGFTLGLSLPLTFFDHGQAEARRAEAQASIASAEAAKEELRARASSGAARAKLRAIADAEPQVGEAIALARKTEAGAKRLYLEGEGNLLDVLQAARSRSELELAFVELVATRAQATLELARAEGRFVETELNSACGGGDR